MMKRHASGPLRRRASEGVCEVDCVDPRVVAAARSALPDDKVMQRAADGFQALAHPGRLRIVKALEGRELCVCDVATLLGISMSGASQQLRELRTIGAVEYRTEGKLAYYTVADPFWLGIAQAVLERLGEPAAASRSRRRRVPA